MCPVYLQSFMDELEKISSISRRAGEFAGRRWGDFLGGAVRGTKDMHPEKELVPDNLPKVLKNLDVKKVTERVDSFTDALGRGVAKAKDVAPSAALAASGVTVGAAAGAAAAHQVGKRRRVQR